MNPDSDDSLEAMLRSLAPQPHPMKSLDVVYACGFAAGQRSQAMVATPPTLATTWSLRSCIKIAAIITAMLGTGLSGYWMGRAGEGRERDTVASVADGGDPVIATPTSANTEPTLPHAATGQAFSLDNHSSDQLTADQRHHHWWTAVVNGWFMVDSDSLVPFSNQPSRQTVLQSGPLMSDSIFLVSSREVENFVYPKSPASESPNTPDPFAADPFASVHPDLSDSEMESGASSHWTPFSYLQNTIQWDEEIQ